MSLSPRLHLRVKQSLSLTPQLMQSIKLLQMNTVELEAFISEALEKNPFLERFEGQEQSLSHRSEQNTQLNTTSKPEEASFQFDENLSYDLEKLEEKNLSYRDFSQNVSQQTFNHDFIQNIGKDVSLYEHIGELIVLTFSDPLDRIIANALMEELDESGYFRGNEDEIIARFGTNKKKFYEIFLLMQEFEPIGLFARDLSECLSLQLKAKNRLDPAMKTLLAHLPLLAKRDFSTLSELCCVNKDDLIDMIAEIRSLDPKPGSLFSSSPVNMIIPDLIIEEMQNGDWRIEVNPVVQPKLLINYDYTTKISSDGSDKTFFNECFQHANWLIRALDQRTKTLINVMRVIAKHQQEFLRHGIKHLRPLTLAEVATTLQMHESTISRATANKYVATPRGTLDMRRFFSTAVGECDQQSADAIRQYIRDFIAAETSNHILSDDMLVSLLKKENIDIARRTITKYRESMNIPSSTLRRREKKLHNKDQKVNTKS